MLPKAAADRVRREAEIRDLNRVVIGHAPELVPPGEPLTLRGHIQADLGLTQMGVDVGVTPVPAVAPVVGLADGSVAGAVERRGRLPHPLDDEAQEVYERLPELSGGRQLEVGPCRLHGVALGRWRC